MKLILCAATAAIMTMASFASAAVLTVTGISGEWENVQGGGATVNGEGTANVRWGTDIGNGQSGYDFQAETTPFVPASSPFNIGLFTHLNFPIGAPSITGADLRVSVMGDVDGTAFSLGGVYRFTHFETPNNDNPCAAGGAAPCPDLVTYTGAVSFFGDDIEVNGEQVVLGLSGFTDGLSFLTAEGQANSAMLQAGFTTTPLVNQVPLPAGVWLMLTGIAIVGGASRAQKRNKRV